MNKQDQLTLSGTAALPQDWRVGNRRSGIILWAIAVGLLILLLVFLAFRSVVQGAPEDPFAQVEGAASAADAAGIHGKKWYDTNGDGKHGEGEPGIPEWQIYLEGSGIREQTKTNFSGFYSFTNIPAGVYTITEGLPDGWVQSFPAGGFHRIKYDPAVPQTGLDFGNLISVAGVIYGQKWFDVDGDGQRDEGEPGIAEWEIFLEGSGIRRQSKTDVGGFYSFTNILAGVYTITEEIRGGWAQTFPAGGFHRINYDPVVPWVGLDFGNRISMAGVIVGQKWFDVDGDSQRDEGEPGIPGWQIFLEGSGIRRQVNTEVSGFYSFTNIPAGTYTITEEMVEGWVQTYPSMKEYEIALPPDGLVEGIDFGNYQLVPGAIYGTKFEDLNGNSRRDQGESGLPGWQIELRGQTVDGKEFERQTTTGNDGSYGFTAVPPGVYLISEVKQAGWLQTFPQSGPHTVAIAPGTTIYGLDFGNLKPPPSRITGIKFHDRNGNGRQDEGEPGLQGWQIVLSSSSDVLVTKTASGGHYSFEDLPPDDYYLYEVQQPGWQQTTSCNSATAVDALAIAGPAATTGEPPQCVFQWGKFLSFNAVADFGNWQPDPGSIQGVKWHDANGNGRRDEGEPGLPGWTINMIGENVKAQATTDADGRYAFPKLDPGKYHIFESPQAGWIQTFPMNNAGHGVLLGLGERVSGVDFGNWDPPPAEIRGIKFEDLDGDGRQDPGEDGLDGWTIVLQGLNSRYETVTKDGGLFKFENLAPGPYLVREINQKGWWPTTPEGGYHALKLGSGDVARADFGNWQPALGSIQGTKWNDLDGDGVRDQGEPGLPGVTIYIDINSSDRSLVTRTDVSGAYQFVELPPGRHTIREIVPDGYRQTFPAEGRHVVEVGVGQDVTGIDFGNWQPPPATIQGTMWHDLNGNGIRNDQEPAIALGKVLIISEDGDSQATQTGEDGAYSFVDLLPGKYRILQRLPAGWQQTYPKDEAHAVALAAGEDVRGIDFGRWQPRAGSIYGQKFEDLNGNGRKDPEEPGLAGWIIYMVDEYGHVRRTLTDENGNYWFKDVLPGLVKVAEVLQYGWQQTMPKDGGHSLNVAPGQAIAGLDFGNQRGNKGYCSLSMFDSNFSLGGIVIGTRDIQNSLAGPDGLGSLGLPSDALIGESLYEVSLVGLPAGTSGSGANGPETFNILGSNPISVTSGTTAEIPIGIGSPISFTQGFLGPALFAVTVTDLTSGESFGCTAGVWPAQEDVIISAEQKGLIQPDATGQTVVNYIYDLIGDVLTGTIEPDLLGPASVNDLENTVTISYTFSAAGEGLAGGIPGILLNGLPVGNSVHGVITAPVGISDTLGVQVSFAEPLPTGPSEVFLELDYGADGVTDAILTAVVAAPVTVPPENKVYLPVVLRP